MALSNNSFLSFEVVFHFRDYGRKGKHPTSKSRGIFVYHKHPFYPPEIFKCIIRSLLDFWLQIIRGSKHNKSLKKRWCFAHFGTGFPKVAHVMLIFP